MTTLATRLDDWAAAHGTRAALITAAETLTYAELAREVRRVAAGLVAVGVGKGVRVGLLMPNRPDWLRCAFAVWRVGATLVPINTLFRAPELAHALRLADVGMLITVARFLNHDYCALLAELCPELARGEQALHNATLPSLRQIAVCGESRPAGTLDGDALLAGERNVPNAGADVFATDSDDAAIFFTSGSTAAPKGVVHTHASMLQAADNVGDRLGLTPDDRTYGYLPFFFNGGLVGVALATLSRGAAVLLQEVFRAEETLTLLERHRCTTLFAWPHQVEALLALPEFGGARLALRKGVGANTKWAGRLYPPDHQAVATWGMTETGPMAASTRFDDPLPVRAGSHGRAMPGLEIRIVDPQTGSPQPVDAEGEIVVRGRSLMRAYYGMSAEECFDRDGFFHTGDCGRLDASGHLHFLGRLKDVIKTAGVNVAAAEVEAVLLAHSAVRVAHVVPVPHPTRGENVAAFVVLNQSPCSAADLRSHCETQLASYKVPRHFFCCREDELPVLGSGKVDRQALRARAAELAAAQSA